jgi:hypothetical protein
VHKLWIKAAPCEIDYDVDPDRLPIRPRLAGCSALQIYLDNFDLFLYELDGVNLGQFSLTGTKLAADANQTLTYLSDGKLGLERTQPAWNCSRSVAINTGCEPSSSAVA